MQHIRWDEEKNTRLIKKRDVSFEDVVLALMEDRILAIEASLKPQYPHQKIIVLELNGYVHLVPYVEDTNGIFLKTIYPVRNYHAKYQHKLTRKDKG